MPEDEEGGEGKNLRQRHRLPAVHPAHGERWGRRDWGRIGPAGRGEMMEDGWRCQRMRRTEEPAVALSSSSSRPFHSPQAAAAFCFSRARTRVRGYRAVGAGKEPIQPNSERDGSVL
jgi:hypothetical protein